MYVMGTVCAQLLLQIFDICLKKQSKKGGRDQESTQSSITPDPGYHMGKWQKHNKAKRSDLSQQVTTRQQ